jgi:hypothetical protein
MTELTQLKKGRPYRSNLTVREAKFVQAVVRDPNQTKAALAAGYAASSAAVTGSQLIRRPNVKAAVMAAIAQMDVAACIRKTHTAIHNLPIEGEDAAVNGNLRLKAIDQISRIAGLEAPRQSQRAVGHFDIDSLLPKGECVIVRDDTIDAIIEPRDLEIIVDGEN